MLPIEHNYTVTTTGIDGIVDRSFWPSPTDWLIFAIFRVLGDASGAPTGGTGGVARCHLERLGIGYDKKIKK